MQLEKKCIICTGSNWIDVDYIRQQPKKMIVCEQCGFITFNRFTDNEEYEAYYERDYRPSTVNISNLVTTNRKLGYHETFIGEYLKENKDLSICDIGAGIGYVLRWARDKYGHKNVTGVELDLHMRRYAQNAFDVTLTKHFDTAKKYDLVCMYHTIEHLPDPVKTLNEIKACLNPGGRLYISSPVWMEEMLNFGGMPFSTFDEHFHENHINAWSKKHFQYFLDKHGWKITKENHKLYGYTILCEPTTATATICNRLDISHDDHIGKEVEYQLQTMQKAATAYTKGNFREAIRLYPKFVDAYLSQVGKDNKDFNMQLKLCDAGKHVCPNTVLFNAQKGMLYYQREMFREAEKELHEALKYKPCDDNIILRLALIAMGQGETLLNTKGKENEGKKILQQACKMFDNIMQINPKNFGQCFDYIGYILSKIPLENEEQPPEFKQPLLDGAPCVSFDDQSIGV